MTCGDAIAEINDGNMVSFNTEDCEIFEIARKTAVAPVPAATGFKHWRGYIIYLKIVDSKRKLLTAETSKKYATPEIAMQAAEVLASEQINDGNIVLQARVVREDM